MRLRIPAYAAMLAALLVILPLAGHEAEAQAQPTVQQGGNAALGGFLTGPDGMTLYVFTNDKPGESVCFDECEQNWPPLTVGAGEQPTKANGIAGTLGVYVRPDGSRQVTLEGKPLYYWAFDSAPGDATGHGVGGVWFVVSSADGVEVLRPGSSGALGPVLTGPNGMTLYVFANDSEGTSNCYDQCATNWPPLLVGDGETPAAAPGLNAGTLATTERTDGTTQVTLDGRPLYYWAFDSAPGDATGHGVGGVWFALDENGDAYPLQQATPAATPASAPGTPAAPPTGTGLAAPREGSPVVLYLALGGALGLFALATGFAIRRRR